jgi:hypothetical protein
MSTAAGDAPAPNAFDDIPSESIQRLQTDAAPANAKKPNAFDDISPDLPLGSEVPGIGGYKRPPPKPLPVVTAPDGQQYDANNAEDLKHLAGMTGRVAVHAVTALPVMAEDLGVGVRNALTGDHYTLPSHDLEAALDSLFGKPQGPIEKATDVLGPAVVGAGATGLPGAARTIFGGAVPELGSTAGGTAGPLSQIPASVLTPDQTKAQFTANLLKRWQAEGGVVPPSQTNPTLSNIIAETVAGKVKTQHEASNTNAAVTDRLASEQLGLNPDAPLTPGALAAVRREAGQGYQAVRRVGPIMTDDQYWQPLLDMEQKYSAMQSAFPGTPKAPIIDDINSLAQSSFPSSPAVDKIIALRDKATAAFNSGDAAMGSDYKALAKNLEDQIERSLPPGSQVLDNFRSARQRIAMSHSVEDALVGEHVSGSKLASSGDPLSGNLKLIADMANQAPKAMQDPNKIGSRVSHLDTAASLLTGGIAEHMTGSPLAIGAGAAWPVGRWLAGKWVQGAPGQSNAIPELSAEVGPRAARTAALAQALSRFTAPQPGQPSR